MLSEDQVRLVEETFEILKPRSDELAATFYRRLFEVAPAVRQLFHGCMERQGRLFMSALQMMVIGLGTPGHVEAATRTLGERHRGYGVAVDDYQVIGSTLLLALEDVLGQDFTPAVRDAWQAAYAKVSSTMRGGDMTLGPPRSGA